MAQKQFKEWRRNNLDFINNYVAEHEQELEALRKKANSLAFDGQWFIIGDPEYPQKRLQYATTSFAEQNVSPRIILYPTGEEDIQKAISLCRELRMAIAVRTGGHQYCGYSSTKPVNMQIDLSKTFDEYDYNKDTKVLRCGVSHSLASWAQKNHKNGIYLPMGMCGSVHLGGHVQTGGLGMVARSHGLLADHVLAFEIILANGEKKKILRPETNNTTQENDDLYYAVLGGGKGGDFGIVTHFEFMPLQDQDNSACYTFTWLWSKKKMEGAVRKMAELSRLCANGTIPSDYEFMMTITGLGKMDYLSDLVKNELRELKFTEFSKIDSLPDSVKDELRELKITEFSKIDSLPGPLKDLLRKLRTKITPKMRWLSDSIKDELRELGIIADLIPVPPLIQVWMCFTNKNGDKEEFDDKWFESFTDENVCGNPLPFRKNRQKKTPVSKGLARYFIVQQNREMNYPFVKRSRRTMDVPEGFPETYTERMYEIMGRFGTRDGQHLVSQQQIYAGGALAENEKAGSTSFSWRKQVLSMSHDSFYLASFLHPNARKKAEEWQSKNDEIFVEQNGFADIDRRMFAYTFGNPVLEEVWPCYYDSQEKYERLKKIKREVDPDGLFCADQFSLNYHERS